MKSSVDARAPSPVALAALVLTAIALRLWFSNAFATAPDWTDPDGYSDLARKLASGARPWHWTVRAVQWHEFFKAPLYQVALSTFTAHPSALPLPNAGLIFHALLDGLTVLATYFLGASLHNVRAGLIAAAVYALWIPNILVVSDFWQEHLFIPLLVIGLALLARAVDRQQDAGRWALAGIVLGLGALTRSVVAYFVPLAAVGCLVLLPRTGVNLRRAMGLLAGFGAVTLPYVLYISTATGYFVPIEDSGLLAIKQLPASNSHVVISEFMNNPARSPSSLEAARFLVADLAAGPSDFIRRHFEVLRLLLKTPGGAFLVRLDASGPTTATLWKGAVHLGMDVPFIAAAVLFPFGVVLSRQRAVASLLALWIVQYLALLTLTLWAGTRYRSPIDPVLIATAVVVLSRGWRPPGHVALAAGVTAAALIAVIVGLSVTSAVRAQPNYGVGAWTPPESSDATFLGRAGLNAFASTQQVTLRLRSAAPAPPPHAIVQVRLNGRWADSIPMSGADERTLTYALPESGLVYLELTAATPEGQPVLVALRVSSDR